MNRTQLFIIVLCLITVNLVAYWFTHPGDAGAYIGGGEVVGEWRCELLDAGNEEQTARWLDRYAPGGPSGVLRMQGSNIAVVANMLCVHEGVQEAGGWGVGGVGGGGGPRPPPQPDDVRARAIDHYFETCAVEDSETRRRQAASSWNLLLGMGLDEARIWKLTHQLEPGCSYVSFQAAILAMKSRSER